MPPRFFAPDARAPGDRVDLPPEEAAHLTRVLRLRTGDIVHVFNGSGGAFEARIEEAGRQRVQISIGSDTASAPEPAVAVTLAQAVLKADKMDAVVRDAVMLGVSAIQPVVSTRSETTRAAIERADRRSRWERIAVASAKQCGRARLPRIAPPCTFDMLVARGGPGATLMFVEPGAWPDALALRALGAERPSHATVVLGPEGGWTAQELGSAAATWQLVTLRLPTVRADAMPSVALSALYAAWRAI